MPKAREPDSASTDPGASRSPALLAAPTYLVAQLGRVAQRLSQEAMADHGLLLPHYSVLTVLADVGPLPQHELADRLGIYRSHLVGYIDQLETRKAVRRQRDPNDRRRQVVSLTPTGEDLLVEARHAMAALQDEFLAPLSADERSVLTDLLARLLKNAGSGPSISAGTSRTDWN